MYAPANQNGQSMRGIAGKAVSDRTAEIVEAVLLLHSLGKPHELIGSQLDLTPAEVAGIVKTGQIPARQKELFAEPSEPKQSKPRPSWERVVEACKIQTASKPTNRNT